VVKLCKFRKALATADANISLDWICYELQERAMDPVALDEFDHGEAVFLDLDMSLENITASKRFSTTFRVILQTYRKPGLQKSRKHIRIHSLQILQKTKCFPRVNSPGY
jgi:hypothetical protein